MLKGIVLRGIAAFIPPYQLQVDFLLQFLFNIGCNGKNRDTRLFAVPLHPFIPRIPLFPGYVFK